jgi:hypothetical protein
MVVAGCATAWVYDHFIMRRELAFESGVWIPQKYLLNRWLRGHLVTWYLVGLVWLPRHKLGTSVCCSHT